MTYINPNNMRKPRALRRKNLKIEKWHDIDVVFIETRDRAFIELQKDELMIVAKKMIEWACWFEYLNSSNKILKGKKRR